MCIFNVLIIEDHVELAENLAEILAGWRFRAITAPSAEDGLRLIEADASITVVLTDYRLPGMNGTELIAELRRRGRRLQAILLTSYLDDAVADRARSAGALATLGKPIDFERLHSSLEDAARRAPSAG